MELELAEEVPRSVPAPVQVGDGPLRPECRVPSPQPVTPPLVRGGDVWTLPLGPCPTCLRPGSGSCRGRPCDASAGLRTVPPEALGQVLRSPTARRVPSLLRLGFGPGVESSRGGGGGPGG